MATITTHTPGPFCADEIEWVETPAGGYRYVHVVRGDGEERYRVALVQVDEDDDEQAANLALFVAAPDVLAEAEKLLALHDSQVFACGRDDEQEVERRITYLRAAIAKARTV